MQSLITTHPLIDFCDRARAIFTSSDYFSSVLYDTVKAEIQIGTKALSSQTNTRDYALSIYQSLEEQPYEPSDSPQMQGIQFFKGYVYIDFLRKINHKDSNIWDETLKYSWTGLLELQENADDILDLNTYFFKLDKWFLFVPEGQRDKDPVLTAIRVARIEINYQHNYTAY